MKNVSCFRSYPASLQDAVFCWGFPGAAPAAAAARLAPGYTPSALSERSLSMLVRLLNLWLLNLCSYKLFFSCTYPFSFMYKLHLNQSSRDWYKLRNAKRLGARAARPHAVLQDVLSFAAHAGEPPALPAASRPNLLWFDLNKK